MKHIIKTIIILLISQMGYSQCQDVYGNDVECPTTEDSMLIYENSLKVYQYYENNNLYRKIKTKKILTQKDFRDCFYKLDSANHAFKEIWVLRERYLKGENVNMMERGVLLPNDGKNIPLENYYERIDDYRFYQRELECIILNTKSPFPLYDTRIAPLYLNVYRNHNSSDSYNGDEVEVALYIPITIKPVALLTKEESINREKILKGTFLKPKVVKEKKVQEIATIRDSIMNKITPDIVEQKYKSEPKTEVVKLKPKVVKKVLKKDILFEIPFDAQPLYLTNGITSSFAGYVYKGSFVKIPKQLYNDYAVQIFARIILNDDIELGKILKIKYGGYINKIVGDGYVLKF
jgi:hypothetical protein